VWREEEEGRGRERERSEVTTLGEQDEQPPMTGTLKERESFVC